MARDGTVGGLWKLHGEKREKQTEPRRCWLVSKTFPHVVAVTTALPLSLPPSSPYLSPFPLLPAPSPFFPCPFPNLEALTFLGTFPVAVASVLTIHSHCGPFRPYGSSDLSCTAICPSLQPTPRCNLPYVRNRSLYDTTPIPDTLPDTIHSFPPDPPTRSSQCSLLHPRAPHQLPVKGPDSLPSPRV